MPHRRRGIRRITTPGHWIAACAARTGPGRVHAATRANLNRYALCASRSRAAAANSAEGG